MRNCRSKLNQHELSPSHLCVGGAIIFNNWMRLLSLVFIDVYGKRNKFSPGFSAKVPAPLDHCTHFSSQLVWGGYALATGVCIHATKTMWRHLNIKSFHSSITNKYLLCCCCPETQQHTDWRWPVRPQPGPDSNRGKNYISSGVRVSYQYR